MQGTIKLFKPEKGFGFIKRDDAQQDVFLHISAASGFAGLSVGQKVGFELGSNSRDGRICAVAVKVLDPVISPRLREDVWRAGKPNAERTFPVV